MSWSAGYVVDTPCTPGFYREMAPAAVVFAALLAGRAVPAPRAALELGCGAGFNAAVLAAANPDCAWTAIDFNPDHIAAAEDFRARACLENLTLSDASFAECRARHPGPFDYVAAHGVYSWIGDDTARDVQDVLRASLAIGGALYLSYNCLPGWAALSPLGRLFAEAAARHVGTSADKARAAVDFARRLADSGAAYISANPAVRARLDAIAGQDPQYLAHEYLNADWRLLYHADVARDMAAAKLSFLGSADPVEAFPELALPAGMRAMVRGEPDPALAETLKDFAVNRQFRRDLFGKGTLRLSAAEREARLLDTALVTLVYPGDLRLELRTAAGDLDGTADAARAMVERLWRDGPLPLRAFVGTAGVAPVLRTAALLVHANQIHPVARAVNEEARAVARRFNATVCERTLMGEERGFFAAPGIGSGIAAGFMEQVVYRALLANPAASAAAVADAVQPELARLGRPVMRAGEPIADVQEQKRELAARLALHLERKVPVWRGLGVL
ncbi:class I SAM-dependent methyltransferase [Azospirillum sp.]|uniref:class I SAM-dependent methyltransferase n=1 Tax=Azospirillum sp. TaxID=34012 RepID=UPI002D281BD8|nr:class I SAM-dependent methyltransferase [Azospirillum sp.]HYD63916.1 class I SAM-dependent methyltransferase [Azospirillum sp.]